MPNEKELILHRCAIYGPSSSFPGYAATLDYLKDTIGQAIADGFITFVTSARDGYELDAAKFICELKQEYSEVRLVIVQPYLNRERFWKTVPIFQEVCSQADMVKYVSVPNDPDALRKTDEWIVGRCSRIICTTNSPYSRIERLQSVDLSGKECIKVAVVWSPSKETYIHADWVKVSKPKKPVYPENLLCDLLNIDWSDHQSIAEEFPDDITDRIHEIASRSGVRNARILELRYSEDKTLQEIGDEYNLSRERIRQIIVRLFRRLRNKRNLAYLRGEGEIPPKRTEEANRQCASEKELSSEMDSAVDETKSEENNAAEVSFKKDIVYEADRWRIWTEEEISGIQRDIETMSLADVAKKYDRQPLSVARLIKVVGMLPGDRFSQYCSEIQPGAFHTYDRVFSYEKWSEEEEIHLLEMLNGGKTIKEIAKAHERTQGAIRSRIAKIAARREYVRQQASKSDAEEIIENTVSETNSEKVAVGCLAEALASFCQKEPIITKCPICGETLTAHQEYSKAWTIACPNDCIKDTFYGL